jgi:general stress protein YciG
MGTDFDNRSVAMAVRWSDINRSHGFGPAPAEPGEDDQYTVGNFMEGLTVTNTGERKERRGFASMSAEKQREIASKGGRAAHEKGTAHEWNADEARNAGRKGGQVSRGGRGRLIVPAETAQPSAIVEGMAENRGE